MIPSAVAAGVQNPFPGLRPFETEQAHLFHGRREQVSELLQRMAKRRFLAVVGTSGTGKSSLVRAGLLPALYRGYMGTAGSRWRIAVMRPGSIPLLAMAQALGSPDALGEPPETWNQVAAVETLGRNSLGLTNLARKRNIGNPDNLLLIVDQFEEIFRFRRERRLIDGGEEAKGFVNLLLAAAEQTEVPVYVVLTMRSDFLGDCAQFPALPEALNQNQYLVPRMTRAQRRQSIEGPLEIAGVPITQRLVQRILSDAGDDPENLPVMQHALMRTFEEWRDNPAEALDIDHYDKAGHIEGALHQHAEKLWLSLSTEHRMWTARLFRCLTTCESGRAVRRPTQLERIFRIVGAANEAEQAIVKSVIRTFAAPDCAFLAVDLAEGISAPSVIDITHESLMAHWKRLREWVIEEAESSDWYKRLVRAAELHAKGQARLWSDPDLLWAWTRRNNDGWNPDWAEQYVSGYAQAIAFLEESKLVQEAEEQAEKERRELELRHAKQQAEAEGRAKRNYLVLAVALTGLLAAAIFLEIQAQSQKAQARAQQQRAEALAIQSDILTNRATAAERTAQAALKEKEAASARGAEADQLRQEAARARSQAETSAKMAASLEQNQASLTDRTSRIIDEQNKQIAALRTQLNQAQKPQPLPPAPTARLTAEPISSEPGSGAALRWQVTGDDLSNVSIDQGIGAVAKSGSRRVALGSSTIYTLKATGPGGTATASATVYAPQAATPAPVAAQATPEVVVLSEFRPYLLRGDFGGRAMLYMTKLPVLDGRASLYVMAQRPGGAPFPVNPNGGAHPTVETQDAWLTQFAATLASEFSAKKNTLPAKYLVREFPLTLKSRVLQPLPAGTGFEFNSVKYEIKVTGKNTLGSFTDGGITVIVHRAPAHP